MWKNAIEPGRTQMAIWHMRVTCWIPKATNTHLQYVIHIAFPLQEWLHERASLSRYTYTACLVIIETVSVYCAVRTKYLYIFQIKFRLQIQAALACFSCSPPKINFKFFAQIGPSKRHHISSPNTKLSPNVHLLPPAAYPNSPPPITITSSHPQSFYLIFSAYLN